MNEKPEIELALKNYFDAFSSKDAQKLCDSLDEGFMYYTDNCKIQKKTEFIDFMMADPWESESYEINGLSLIPSAQNDLIVAVYNSSFTGKSNGKPMKVYATETTVFTKKKSVWKILHSHTSNKV